MKLQEWIGSSKLAQDEFKKKYQYKDETFDQWLERVTNNNKDIQQYIIDKKFIYGGRILANRGLQNDGNKITYSNCYVLTPPEDSIESIYETCSKLARTFSYGGGCGIDISNLRPKGYAVHNAAKSTSGAVSFMDTFSQVAETIGQAGRRGALMISMRCDHPDIEEFIDIKTDLNRVTKANISVMATDKFIKAARENESFNSKFEIHYEKDLCTDVEVKPLDASALLDKLAYNNWRMAEPGILYWDTIQRRNLLQYYHDFSYAGVNPCAEEPLPAGGSCLLGSINLSELVENPFTDKAEFNFNELSNVVRDAVFALNDVLLEGLQLHPLQEQRNSVSDWRQIGLGIMGLADALIKLGIKYGSDESIEIIEEISAEMLYSAICASNEYMKVYHHKPFGKEKYDGRKILESDIIKDLMARETPARQILLESKIEEGLFNSQLLTVPPTGTIAGLCDTSYGIEPQFAFKYTRKTESLHGKDEYYDVEASIVQRYREATGDTGELPDYFISAHELNPFDRIKVQAAMQKFVDASISSTINLHENATPEDIRKLYLYASDAGLKGLTVYRNNCERAGILTVDKKEEKQEEPKVNSKVGLKFGDTIMVNDDNIGIKRKLNTGCGSLHCTFYFCPESGELREVFLDKGSTGGCLSLLNAVSRLTSLCARKGAPVEEIVDQLESVLVCPSYRCKTALTHETSKGTSCGSAVAYALKDAHESFMDQFINEDIDDEAPKVKTVKKEKIAKAKESDNFFITCPSCGEKSAMKTEGCISCTSCGYSKCN